MPNRSATTPLYTTPIMASPLRPRATLVVLLLACVCLGQISLVRGRTVLEHENDEGDQPWGLGHQDTGEDFWPILCPENNWFSKEQATCRVCSSCPEDHFITRPCYRFHDTKCSPLHAIPQHFFTPSSSSQSRPLVDMDNTRTSGLLLRRGSGAGRRDSPEDQWRPAAVVLGVIVGVLVLALLVTSVAVCVVWRRQREVEATPTKADSSAEKLVCSYSPAPSETDWT
ncbi:hypothetical protein EGW08_006729 [Elysia chlorotica]|uniref:TNFR-Cys domain-containing protein n=1 Tax=Elysia chlorotica TaxID=188477 RepID=A0A433TVA9_ELYCH|nr:hypothetical protein EGW08_006729 [Elysia chlorotica]